VKEVITPVGPGYARLLSHDSWKTRSWKEVPVEPCAYQGRERVPIMTLALVP
jgi:hypothetical protein